MNLHDVRSWLRDPGVSWWRKALLLGAGLYVFMPLDAVPDLVPLAGWLDDVGVVGLSVSAALSDVRRRAQARAGVRAGR